MVSEESPVDSNLCSGLITRADAIVGDRGVLEIAPFADEAGFGRQAVADRAGEDRADFAAGPGLVIGVFAQDRGAVLAAELAVVVLADAGGQVDLAAHEGVGVVAADALAAAVLVAEIAFVAQDDAVAVTPDDAADAVGVVDADAVRQGEAHDPVAVAGGELVGAVGGVAAALEQEIGAGEDRFVAGLGLGDDVHDHRIALHVDARSAAADQFDTLDLGHQGAAEDRRAGVVLGGRAGAVDQDVADRAFEAARAVAVLDREAGDAADHVESGVGALVGEEVGGENQDALLAGLGLGRTGDLRGRGRCLRQGAAGAEHDGRRGQKNGLGHRLGFPSLLGKV